MGAKREHARGLAVITAVITSVASHAQAEEPTTPRVPLTDEPLLQALTRDALEHRPEIAAARARLQASRERVREAGAFPDPTLTLGIQNDGFNKIRVGEAETSYYLIALTQPIPFPGKRGMREEVAALATDAQAAETERALLSTEADVARAYVDLLLARDQLSLLLRLQLLWSQAEEVARSRYEVGEGSQADLLRAQLERTRLSQQRWALEAAARAAEQVLNRLRGRPLSEAIVTASGIDHLADPPRPELAAELADAEARSPELKAARAAVASSSRRVDLARREIWPDFSVSAGVMPRGSIEPMWQLSLGVSLPVFAGSRQLPAIDESRAEKRADESDEDAIRERLRLAVEQRLAILDAVLMANELYRGGLLVQSDASVSSALAQYQVGKVPFTAVLEALNGSFADRSGYLASVAQAQLLAIAQRELALDLPAGPAPALGATAMGGASGPPPAAAGMNSSSRGARTGAAAPTPRQGNAAGVGGGM